MKKLASNGIGRRTFVIAALVLIALTAGAVGGVIATGGSGPAHKVALVQRTSDNSPVQNTGSTGDTGNTGGGTTTTTAPPATTTTLPSPSQSATDAANSATSAANSATSAAQSATSAANSASQAQAAASDPPATTTTTTQPPSYCTGSLASDQSAPALPTPPSGIAMPEATCTDSVGSFFFAAGVSWIPSGWYLLS